MIPTALHPLGRRATPLPYDSLVEYVESTGAQRIELSGFAFGNNIEVECRFSWRSVPDSRNGIVFGCGQGIFQRNRCFALFTQRSNGSLFYIASTSTLSALCGSMPTFPVGPNVATGFHTVRLGLSSGFVVDGVQYSDFSSNTAYPADIASAARKFQIFACFNSNDQSQASGGFTYGKCRIAWFKAVDQSGKQYDFVPVRVGAAGALYDRVSGTLYYSATSTALIPGPDLP